MTAVLNGSPPPPPPPGAPKPPPPLGSRPYASSMTSPQPSAPQPGSHTQRPEAASHAPWLEQPPAHASTEQSAPDAPAKQLHTPKEHTPRPRQSARHGGGSEQPAPTWTWTL